MQEVLTSVFSYLSEDRVVAIAGAVVTILAGLLIAKVLGTLAVRVVKKQSNPHLEMVARRTTFYLVAGLFVATGLSQMGFNIGILLGAAGFLTVAIGFASQSSASNIISGLFLLGEKSFEVGDVIRVGTTTGEVLSIDLLSVKIRTFDNLFVRVANENVIKSEITNLSRFPIRRLDMKIGVAYKEDLKLVFRVLEGVADANTLCLDEPVPLFIFEGYGDSALTLQFSVWCERNNFLQLKNQMHLEVKAAFDKHGIEIPFPHRSLYTGSVTEPFPIRLVDGGSGTLPPLLPPEEEDESESDR
ncbi:mechanosensitive ion channel family protein [Bacteroidota bacterium]